jgi:hypothetical protein
MRCLSGAKQLEEEELKISRAVLQRLLQHRRIIVLGRNREDEGRHLPIFSMLFRHGQKFLHHNFVFSLLNDLFGIQSRGESTGIFSPFCVSP